MTEPAVNSRIQSVRCARCGAEDVLPAGQDFHLCSPCRAELTGTVIVYPPPASQPTWVKNEFWRVRRSGSPEAAARAIEGWAAALEYLASAARGLLAAMLARTDEEAVAEAVICADGLAVDYHDGGMFGADAVRISGLSPSAARLAAESAGNLIRGPDLPEAEARALAGGA